MWGQNITNEQYWNVVLSMGYPFWCGVLAGIIVFIIEVILWWKIRKLDHILFYIIVWILPTVIAGLTMFLLGGFNW